MQMNVWCLTPPTSHSPPVYHLREAKNAQTLCVKQMHSPGQLPVRSIIWQPSPGHSRSYQSFSEALFVLLASMCPTQFKRSVYVIYKDEFGWPTLTIVNPSLLKMLVYIPRHVCYLSHMLQ